MSSSVLARGQQVTAEFFERKSALARRRLDQIDPRAKPTRSPQLHFVESAALVRQLSCTNYGACLDVAFTERWEGFSCEACPAYRPLSRYDQLADVEGMARLLRTLFPPCEVARRYVNHNREGGACEG